MRCLSLWIEACDMGSRGQNSAGNTEHSSFPLPGVATFRCLAPDGIWESQGPDLSNCSSPWINHITQKVKPFMCVDHTESAYRPSWAPWLFSQQNPKWPTMTCKAWAMHSSQESQRESKIVKIWWKLRQRGWGKGKGEGLDSGIKLERMTVLVRGKKRRKREEEVGVHTKNTDLCQKETFPFTHPQGFSHAT